jgi:hypothetical protein
VNIKNHPVFRKKYDDFSGEAVEAGQRPVASTIFPAKDHG